MDGSNLDPTREQTIKEAWRLYPDTFAAHCSGGRWVPYPWLQYLAERITPSLVNGGGRFVVTAPPQHGKSEFISHWVPSWYLSNFQRRKVILASYAADYATKWGAKVKETLTGNPLAWTKLSQFTQAKKRFATDEGGQMISVGIGGPATGEGAHLLIIDDPIKNWEEANSPQIRERNHNWYLSVARTRLQPSATVIVLQTRWHEDDLAGRLIEAGGFEVINLPAICEDPDKDLLGRSLGEALCPERYDAANLAGIEKDVGGLIWSAMYQGSPVSQGGNVVKAEWLKYYDERPELESMDELGLFADLSYKGGEENDYAVFELWGRRGPNIYLLDQVRDQMDFPRQLAEFLNMADRYPRAFHKEIEEKANGAALISMVKESVPGIIANNPRTEKLARLASVAPLYHAGNVFYPNPAKYKWAQINVNEITRFPRAKNDDTVDVASMACTHLGRMNNALKRLAALAKR